MNYKEELIAIIKKHIPQAKIYLFGSRARKTHHPGSDIDIALDAGIVLDRGIIGEIKEEIENSTIPFFVDIVDLQAVSEQMREQILKEGILWTI